MKLLKLILKRKSVSFFFLFSVIIAFAYRYLPIPTYKEMLLGALIAAILIIIEQSIEVWSLYKRFKNIEGNYLSYSYETEDPKDSKYDQLKDDGNGADTIKYLGGNEFEIEHRTKEGKYQWNGRIEFKTINIASLAWWYIKPPGLRDSCGYKKLVVLEDVKPVRIYMFSEDRQRYGREALIKEA